MIIKLLISFVNDKTNYFEIKKPTLKVGIIFNI